MLRYLQLASNLVSPRERAHLLWLVVIVTVGAFVEVLGVFSVLPFLAAAADPGMIQSNPVLQRVYSMFEFDSVREFLIASGFFTIFALVFNHGFGGFVQWFRVRACYAAIRGISERLFDAYLGQRYPFFLSRNSAILSKNLLNEVGDLSSRLLQPLATLIAQGLVLLFLVTALAIFNWVVAVTAFLGFGLIFGVIYALIKRRLEALGEVGWSASEEAGKFILETLSGIKDVKLSGYEASFSRQFQATNRRITVAVEKSTIYGILPRAIVETMAFSALVAAVLTVLLRDGQLGAVIPAVGLYAAAAYRLMPAMMSVFSSVTALRQGRVPLERLHRAIQEAQQGAEPIAATTGRAVLPFRREFAFRDVQFSYESSPAPVLRRVSFSIPGNSYVGFVGASGAGKSTIMDLCLGLLAPTAGAITIDGVELGEKNRRAWQRNLGYVAQQIYLNDASILANIAWGIPAAEIDVARVERVARLAKLHDFVVSELPQRYATEVGERGVRLSGGQRQRIGIARALYHDPAVLFFDEATNALDNETEDAVVESIQSIAHQRTIIMIAHRLSSLRHCDKIFVLEAGAIVRECRYEDLALPGGLENLKTVSSI